MTKIHFDNLPIKLAADICEWCVDTFGPAGERWYLEKLDYLVFEKDRDATLVLLRWSGQQ